jgi:4'-phosphopantetheinyl transferase
MTEPTQLKWSVPGEFPALATREIHLWCADLGQPDGPDPAGAGCLSADEAERAASFHFPADRHRFVASRRNLRHVLAGYVGRDPGTLVFNYGRFGKPNLVHRADVTGPFDPTLSNLCFNQSHCGSLWLLAVAWNQPVGVDIEEVKDLPDLALLEEKIFTAEDLPHQRALAAVDRQLGFFQRWTQLEAAAKFLGIGFEPTDRYVPPDQSELLTPAEGYVGALAYGGAAVRIRRLGWDETLLRRAEPAAATADPAAAPQRTPFFFPLRPAAFPSPG